MAFRPVVPPAHRWRRAVAWAITGQLGPGRLGPAHSVGMACNKCAPRGEEQADVTGIRDSDEWSDLMRAALGGDERSYRALLTALAPALRGMARRDLLRVGLDPSDAEDVVQETLLALHLKRQTWDPASPLGPWVRAIARHKVVDVMRRRGRKAEVPLADWEDVLTQEAPEEQLTEREAQRLTDALHGRERDVVEAICLSGESVKQAGNRLAMSEGAVRVALHRGLKRLAALYRSKGE